MKIVPIMSTIFRVERTGNFTVMSNIHLNFLARDAEQIVEKAKQYKIPVAIIGSGEKQTVEFLDRDKAVVEQIFSEVMQERINGAPQSVKCFSVGENNAAAMKATFEKNNIGWL